MIVQDRFFNMARSSRSYLNPYLNHRDWGGLVASRGPGAPPDLHLGTVARAVPSPAKDTGYPVMPHTLRLSAGSGGHSALLSAP